jgi:alkanesulfonate monooxygenase SsuD/methylene tetrahydromethanopterin reductase-like flavin-dependent oxidoreductase (luciferase family)
LGRIQQKEDKMKLSLQFEISSDDPLDQKQIQRAYHEATEQVMLADELGYHCVWLTEHHFVPTLSHSSAPEVTLAYWAGKTKNIRLGHGVVLMPGAINHPIRSAERTAVLDILSNGRLEVGCGRSVTSAELLGFNVDPEDSREQWEEGIRLLPKAWTQEQVSANGKHIKFPERVVTPKPMQQPHPRMYSACTQPSTLELAGKMGLGALVFGVGYKAIAEYSEIYRNAIKEAEPVGGFINEHFVVNMFGLCAPTDEEAVAIQGHNFKRYFHEVRELLTPWQKGTPPKTFEYILQQRIANAEKAQDATLQEIIDQGSAAIGSPETVLGILQTLAENGADEVMLMMQGHDTPHKDVLRSIELIAKEVMPKLASSSKTAAVAI